MPERVERFVPTETEYPVKDGYRVRYWMKPNERGAYVRHSDFEAALSQARERALDEVRERMESDDLLRNGLSEITIGVGKDRVEPLGEAGAEWALEQFTAFLNSISENKMASEEKKWPEVELCRAKRTGAIFVAIGEEPGSIWELRRYYPAGAPNVLSALEAKLVWNFARRPDLMTTLQMERFSKLVDRLTAYAEQDSSDG